MFEILHNFSVAIVQKKCQAVSTSKLVSAEGWSKKHTFACVHRI
jgi:hypothetical protein